jgi:pimeloyl-ACP methyl ester carboxylesterase
MATYVLVHGAWHGGWCWRLVRAALEDKGHTVFTPTLTGLGERSHLLSPAIDLDTHITDVVNVIEWEELGDVILVGHSYGGYVITGVADRIKPRLRHAVYLDAFMPDDGESSASFRLKTLNPDATAAEIAAEIARRKASANEQGGAPTHYTNLFDIPKEMTELYAWVERRITLHPVGSQIQPIRLRNGGSDGLPRTYILCAGSPEKTPFMILAERYRGDPTWRVLELPTGHDAMVTMPGELAAMLMEVDSG